MGDSVSIAVAIVRDERDFLLVRRRAREGALRWQFPSGHVEFGENSKEAAEREVFEETHVKCRALSKIGERVHPDTGARVSYWLCAYESGVAEIGDKEELDDITWMSGPQVIKAITSDLFAPVREMLESSAKASE